MVTLVSLFILSLSLLVPYNLLAMEEESDLESSQSGDDFTDEDDSLNGFGLVERKPK